MRCSVRILNAEIAYFKPVTSEKEMYDKRKMLYVIYVSVRKWLILSHHLRKGETFRKINHRIK